MIRFLKILALRWRCWWLEVAIEIDNAGIDAHSGSLKRNLNRLERLEFALDQLHAPQSLIMQALRRKG